MREAVKRARWLALTLFIVCVGALSYPAPSAHSGPDVGPSFALQDGSTAVVVPTSSWTATLFAGDASSPPRARRSGGRASPRVTSPAHGVRGPSTPEIEPERSSASLLGLHAAPANAPPHA